VNKARKKIDLALPAFFALIIYLVINTGIVSDDITFTCILKNAHIGELIIPRICLHTPAESIFFFIWYPFFDFNNMVFVNIIKILYVLVSFFLISKFFGIFLNRINSLCASFLFLFFPSHDSTVYWFLGQYLTLSMAFYLYAYYLAHGNRLKSAFFFALMASFISYGSPAIAVSLFTIFALKKEFKKGLVLLVPNIIYSAYYIVIAKFLSAGINRIPSQLDIFAIGKQFVLQAVGFIDAALGPSMWMKIYYSFSQLSIPSIIVGIAAIALLFRACKNNKEKPDGALITGLSVMAIASFVLFAITGWYPQLAFNLGNRTTIFGSLLLAYLLFSAPLPKNVKMLFLGILVLSVLGISDHWKAWSTHQEAVISNISNNREMKMLEGDVYVSGNQYSKYGPISHIEFLSETSVVEPLFQYLLGDKINAKALNKRQRYEDGYLYDIKYGEKEKIGDYMMVYDSEGDRLIKLKPEEINTYLDSLPPDNRHWIQTMGSGWLKDRILYLLPRLKYAL